MIDFSGMFGHSDHGAEELSMVSQRPSTCEVEVELKEFAFEEVCEE